MASPSGGQDGSAQVDAYLEEVGQPQRDSLIAVRGILRRILPHTDECLKYAMPAVALDGKGVAGYAAFADHCSYFPMSGSVLETAGDAVAGFTVSKGGLQFPIDKPPGVGLIRKLVKLRLAEIADVRSGTRREYFDDGQLKAAGPMKDGELHGRWRWYRKDGTLSRTGQFAMGARSGTWETWDRAGNLVTRTSI